MRIHTYYYFKSCNHDSTRYSKYQHWLTIKKKNCHDYEHDYYNIKLWFWKCANNLLLIYNQNGRNLRNSGTFPNSVNLSLLHMTGAVLAVTHIHQVDIDTKCNIPTSIFFHEFATFIAMPILELCTNTTYLIIFATYWKQTSTIL